jgi:hypothetical protein
MHFALTGTDSFKVTEKATMSYSSDDSALADSGEGPSDDESVTDRC